MAARPRRARQEMVAEPHHAMRHRCCAARVAARLCMRPTRPAGWRKRHRASRWRPRTPRREGFRAGAVAAARRSRFHAEPEETPPCLALEGRGATPAPRAGGRCPAGSCLRRHAPRRRRPLPLAVGSSARRGKGLAGARRGRGPPRAPWSAGATPPCHASPAGGVHGRSISPAPRAAACAGRCVAPRLEHWLAKGRCLRALEKPRRRSSESRCQSEVAVRICRWQGCLRTEDDEGKTEAMEGNFHGVSYLLFLPLLNGSNSVESNSLSGERADNVLELRRFRGNL